MKLRANKKKKLYALLTLLSIFVVILTPSSFLLDFSYSSSNLLEENRDESIGSPKSNDLLSNNVFTGTGAPWKVSHWANRTDSNLQVNFGNETSDSKYIDLGFGWEGYQLNGTVNDLSDERNWVNGTFQAGPDDNSFGTDENDSNDVLNWTFVKDDIIGFTNPMSGNYYDDGNAVPDFQDSLEFRITGGGSSRGYDKSDACYWYTDFEMPRGEIIDGEIKFSVYPETFNDYGNHFVFQVLINNVNVYTRGLLALVEECPDPINGDWLDVIVPLDVYFNDPQVFPEGIKSMNVTLKFKRVGATLDTSVYLTSYRAFADNVSLNLKAQVNATQIGLNMNNVPVNDGEQWGEGIVSQISSWTTSPVEFKFNTTEDSPPPEMGGYNVEFTTNLNLFARKMNDDSHHQPNFIGTSFEATNDSSVEWESYARVSVPTGYDETNMTIEFPEDVNITWISNAENPNTNMLQYCNNLTTGLLKVFNFSETPDGFWWVKGKSPNYCTELNIYNDVTGSWVLNNTFLSGDYVNITAKVNPSPLVSSYITQTNAIMNIRFPNGTIWTAQNQIKSCDSNGMVYFDSFQLPLNPPNYEVGEYDVIITWNNSHSNFGLNESGVIFKKLTVKHFSSLTPDQQYYSDIFEGSTINLIVSFTDRQNGDAIENAIVYLHNFKYTTYLCKFYFIYKQSGKYNNQFNPKNKSYSSRISLSTISMESQFYDSLELY